MGNNVPKVSNNPYKGVEKKARAAKLGAAPKVPSIAPSYVEDPKKRSVRFRFDRVDYDAPWSLLNISKDDHRELLDFLSNVETMTAGEVFDKMHDLAIGYDMDKCPNEEAKQRLVDEYQAADNVYRLRLSGLKRIYGLRHGNEFSIIWWDPKHQIWPSTKS